MNLIILTSTKIDKKAAIFRRYDHLQASGFTFENNAKKETYKVKLIEKLDFIDQTYSFEASKHDFKTIYKDMNMMFIWKDQKFYRSNANGLAEMYNDILKEKKYYPLAINDIFYGNNILL